MRGKYLKYNFSKHKVLKLSLLNANIIHTYNTNQISVTKYGRGFIISISTQYIYI